MVVAVVVILLAVVILRVQVQVRGVDQVYMGPPDTHFPLDHTPWSRWKYRTPSRSNLLPFRHHNTTINIIITTTNSTTIKVLFFRVYNKSCFLILAAQR